MRLERIDITESRVIEVPSNVSVRLAIAPATMGNSSPPASQQRAMERLAHDTAEARSDALRCSPKAVQGSSTPPMEPSPSPLFERVEKVESDTDTDQVNPGTSISRPSRPVMVSNRNERHISRFPRGR